MPIDINGSFPLRETEEDACQFCGAALLGEPIPESSRRFYGASTHFRREIGVETEDYDGILFYVCPDCHRAWPRFVGSDRLAVLATEAVAKHDHAAAALGDKDKVLSILTEHAEVIAFATGLAGLRWTHWVVDPMLGATVFLLVEQVINRPIYAHIENAQRLASEATGLHVAISQIGAPGVAERLAVAHPAPNGTR